MPIILRLLKILVIRIFYKMPGYLQGPGSFLYLNYYLPIKSGPVKYLKIYTCLKKSQWWPRLKLEQYQTERLRQLLRHAYKNVPYYTDIFKKLNLTPKDIKSIEDLRRLPILTKEGIVKHFDKLISAKVNKKYITLISTSGSTGKPMEFYRDERASPIESFLLRRNSEWANLKVYDKNVRLWSRPFIEKAIKDVYLSQPFFRRLSLSTVSCEAGRLDEYIKLLKEFNPIYITGNPSMLYHLACYAQEKNINDIKFKCFISYYENLFPCQKELIKKQFNCEVFNYYSTAERAIYAMECPEHLGMHIGMERGILEIIGEDGKIMPEGEQGRIIATGFYNYAMPLIRYDVGDIGAISEKPCPCGRGLPVLKSLDGRANEV